MALEVRAPQSTDEIRSAFALVQALAAHESASEHLKIAEDAFLEAASGDTPTIHILLGLLDGKIVGIVTYFRRFHIWNGTDIYELDDLYVSADARGNGLGTKLLETLGQKAKAQGMGVKWQVNADNHGAIALYKRMGASYTSSGICFWRPENI